MNSKVRGKLKNKMLTKNTLLDHFLSKQIKELNQLNMGFATCRYQKERGGKSFRRQWEGD